MTHEEFLAIDKQINAEKLAEERAFMAQLNKKYSDKLRHYIEERIDTMNTLRIGIGDIITDGEVMLQVERMNYGRLYRESETYIEFRGTPLTKSLKPTKREARNFIQQRYGIMPIVIKRHD